MLGGPLDWFMAAFDIGTAIDGFRNEAEDRRQFAHIDSSLNNIRNQLTQIQTELTNLAALINKSTSGILAAVYDYGAAGNAVNTLSDIGLGLGDFDKPACEKLANYLVALNPPVPIVNQCLILENYFTQLLTYQFKGMAINLNISQAADSTFVPTILTDFNTVVSGKIRSFLRAANFIALFAEYPTSQLLSRSRFVANLFYDAIGLPYPAPRNMYPFDGYTQYILNHPLDSANRSKYYVIAGRMGDNGILST